MHYVQTQIPDLGGVCSGAIASDYQRLRVESVCQRLGLISLAWLWRQPQQTLLEKMIDFGMVTILIKVAAIGLVPEIHLGKRLEEMKEHLIRLRNQYGCNVCGEGGEYETLVLDAPFFKRRIQIIASSISKDPTSGQIAPSGTLNVTSFELIPKREQTEQPQVHLVPMDTSPNPDSLFDNRRRLNTDSIEIKLFETDLSLFLQIEMKENDPISSDVEKTRLCLELQLTKLEEVLESRGLSFADIVFVYLYLNDMDHFGNVNEIYKQFFPAVDPPSRACIQMDIVSCKIHVLVIKSEPASFERSVLHVQSISNWAPCCIGPYSQATSIGGVTFVAGQLGLDPITLHLAKDWKEELALAMQHCRSIAVAVGSKMSQWSLKVVFYLSESFAPQLTNQDKQEWKSMIDSYWPGSYNWEEPKQDSEESKPEQDLYLKAPYSDIQFSALLSFVVVPRLPKDAKIEIQMTLLDNKISNKPRWSSGLKPDPSVSFTEGKNCSVEWTRIWNSRILQTRISCSILKASSDGFMTQPFAKMVTISEGPSLIQICVPQTIAELDQKSSLLALLVHACSELLSSCFQHSRFSIKEIMSMTCWFNKEQISELQCQELIRDVSHIDQSGSIDKCSCLPSSGIGVELAMSRLLLIDVTMIRTHV